MSHCWWSCMQAAVGGRLGASTGYLATRLREWLQGKQWMAGHSDPDDIAAGDVGIFCGMELNSDHGLAYNTRADDPSDDCDSACRSALGATGQYPISQPTRLR